MAIVPVQARFVTRYYGSARLGVGKYEEALYPQLAELSGAVLAPIQPLPLPSWLVQAVRRLGRDLRAVAENIPLHVPNPIPGTALYHLSNEVLAPALLMNRGPSVITVHHLPPVWEPYFRREAGGLLWVYVLSLLALRYATRIIVDSAWTASELRRRMHIPAQQIDVIPLGVDPTIFRQLEGQHGIRERFGLGEGPHVFYVGSFGPRKNVTRLIEAFRLLRRRVPTAELLLAGPVDLAPAGFVEQWIHSTPGCRVLGYVSVEDLVALYNSVTVFVMPSKLEGFSCPVIEAMACGAPVLAANSTALPELVRDVGFIFDANDSVGLCDLLERVCTDHVLRDGMSQRSLAQAARYTWRRTAELTLASYQRVVGPSA